MESKILLKEFVQENGSQIADSERSPCSKISPMTKRLTIVEGTLSDARTDRPIWPTRGRNPRRASGKYSEKPYYRL